MEIDVGNGSSCGLVFHFVSDFSEVFHHGWPFQPLRRVPKPAELLKERGVKILSLDLDDIDGLAAKVQRKGRVAARVIVVKKSMWVRTKALQLGA